MGQYNFKTFVDDFHLIIAAHIIIFLFFEFDTPTLNGLVIGVTV